ncbi:hypothetical protein KTE13_20355 [Burkholderia multivorans]|uniref:hypothetical protein n=1 Tax=Burkholderia multivorans TaxID=87883 RepID=UPI001C245FAC|nr:hypothetical protein [Burkholderia multivorans]MBU9402096.1 hypothetical protein [Burkholderia multivorans]
MTVEEAANYLFASRPHVRKLLTHGTLLEVLPRNPSGEFDIDVTSVEAYRAKRDASIQAWLDMKNEDNESL